MSRMRELIQELCPDGVEYRPLGDVGRFLRGSSFQKKHFQEDGTPCIHYGQVHTRFGVSTDHVVTYLDNGFAAKMKRAKHGDLVIATTSEDDEAVGKATAWMGDHDVVISNDAFIYRHTLDPMYASYFFSSDQFQQAKMPYITGSKVRRLSGDDMSKISIPVPPIEVQREVVRILDSFQELDDALAAEIKARDYLNSHLVDSLLGDIQGVNQSKLSEMCVRITKGTTPKTVGFSFENEGILFIKTESVDNSGHLVSERVAYISNECHVKLNRSQLKAGDILFSIAGAIGRTLRIEDSMLPANTNQALAIIRLDGSYPVLNEYVYHMLASNYVRNQIQKRAIGSAQQNVSLKDIGNLLLPIPSIAQQKQLVSKIEAIKQCSDYLVHEREARRKQFEYYRDQLLSFPEKDS